MFVPSIFIEIDFSGCQIIEKGQNNIVYVCPKHFIGVDFPGNCLVGLTRIVL